jgi:hypothetical protein
MRAGIDLDPPERQIGLAAHDFEMAMGAANVVLSRAARAGDAPAVASRWLQRLVTFAGPGQTEAMRARGNELLAWARQLDESEGPFRAASGTDAASGSPAQAFFGYRDRDLAARSLRIMPAASCGFSQSIR